MQLSVYLFLVTIMLKPIYHFHHPANQSQETGRNIEEKQGISPSNNQKTKTFFRKESLVCAKKPEICVPSDVKNVPQILKKNENGVDIPFQFKKVIVGIIENEGTVTFLGLSGEIQCLYKGKVVKTYQITCPKIMPKGKWRFYKFTDVDVDDVVITTLTYKSKNTE